jgi:hypothetical protein
MSVFSDTLRRILNNYKIILKKNLSSKKKTLKFSALGLKRQQLKQASDAVLYTTAQRVLEDIEQSIDASDKKGPSLYCGLHTFYKHLKNTLADYSMDQDVVVHANQQSSRTLVKAIQLITLAKDKPEAAMATKLDQCGLILAKLGSKEQQEKLVYALNLHKEHNSNFFLPLLDNFERYLSQ